MKNIFKIVFRDYEKLEKENEDLKKEIKVKNDKIEYLNNDTDYYKRKSDEYFNDYYELKDNFDKKLLEKIDKIINKIKDLIEIKNKLQKDLVSFKFNNSNIEKFNELFKLYDHICKLIENERR